MTRTEVIAWLNDLLCKKDDDLHPQHARAIKAAVGAIGRPVHVEIWSDGEQRVSASPLLKVKIRNYSRYGRCDI